MSLAGVSGGASVHKLRSRARENGAARAFAFLTVFGRGLAPSPSSLCWFPLVGATLGAGLGLAWWGLSHIFPPLVTALIVVAADVALTGMLHFDGLLDSADGLLPHLTVERRLAVMAEPCVGAFAVVTGIVVVFARVAALAVISPGPWWKPVLLLGALWVVSRSVMVLAATQMRYARPEGIAAAFLVDRSSQCRLVATRSIWAGATGIAVAAAALLAWRVVAGAPVLAGSLLGGGIVLFLASRRIGGFTGDVLGAAGVFGETVGLVVAAAKW
ncbi:MAG: adenosylcobinamide-GDP ribazoletransferase [Acidimicrobiales bacterium]